MILIIILIKFLQQVAVTSSTRTPSISLTELDNRSRVSSREKQQTNNQLLNTNKQLISQSQQEQTRALSIYKQTVCLYTIIARTLKAQLSYG